MYLSYTGSLLFHNKRYVSVTGIVEKPTK